MRVGLTGGISSGKTTVLSIFQSLGAGVLEADKIVGRIILGPMKEKICSLLDIDCGLPPNAFKQKIAEIIFSDASAREEYLSLLYPIVFEKMEEAEASCKNDIVIWEVPLLFEARWDEFFDRIVYVRADAETRLRRWIGRGGIADDFFKRESLFKKEEEKIEKSDFVIENGLEIDYLNEEVNKIWNKILKEVRNGR